MQCVILAGGLATRLRPITETIPKSMVEVCGLPFLAYQLEILKRNGVDEVVLCVGHLSEQIEEYFKDGEEFGIKILYSREEEGLLGTGGALKNALSFLQAEFFLIYGDSYLDIDYRPVYDRFLQIDSPLLMTVFKNDNRWVESNVIYDAGSVTVFDKQAHDPAMRYIDYGLSVLSRSILDEIPDGEPYSLDHIYHRLAGEGRLAGYEVFQRFYEIGSPEGLEELRNKLDPPSAGLV
jgi:N-acetyl-alpha-D-muramate 1-phosphate uridylyltransferase